MKKNIYNLYGGLKCCSFPAIFRILHTWERKTSGYSTADDFTNEIAPGDNFPSVFIKKANITDFLRGIISNN